MRGRAFPQSGKRHCRSPWLSTFVYGLTLTVCTQPVHTRLQTTVPASAVAEAPRIFLGDIGSKCGQTAFGCCPDMATSRMDTLGTNCFDIRNADARARRRPLSAERRWQLRVQAREERGNATRVRKQLCDRKVSIFFLCQVLWTGKKKKKRWIGTTPAVCASVRARTQAVGGCS